mmetsp:Transcript_5344/g.11226  ORF Transcript_5344/g.11226 Transcript_5344/m.11226 type:complete len:117 (-) Transcript_5344:249-599(-)
MAARPASGAAATTASAPITPSAAGQHPHQTSRRSSNAPQQPGLHLPMAVALIAATAILILMGMWLHHRAAPHEPTLIAQGSAVEIDDKLGCYDSSLSDDDSTANVAATPSTRTVFP